MQSVVTDVMCSHTRLLMCRASSRSWQTTIRPRCWPSGQRWKLCASLSLQHAETHLSHWKHGCLCVQSLITQLADDDKATLLAVWTALEALCKTIPRELAPTYVRCDSLLR